MTMDKKRKRAVRGLASATGRSYEGTLRAQRGVGGPPAPARFETIAQETIHLAAVWRGGHKNRTKDGMGSLEELADMGRFRERYEREHTNPKYLALLNHLQAQSEDDVFKLTAIMYAGQDDVDLLQFGSNIRGIFPTKDIAIIQMMSKAPLAEYLSSGLHVAREQGVSVEAPLPY